MNRLRNLSGRLRNIAGGLINTSGKVLIVSGKLVLSVFISPLSFVMGIPRCYRRNRDKNKFLKARKLEDYFFISKREDDRRYGMPYAVYNFHNLFYFMTSLMLPMSAGSSIYHFGFTERAYHQMLLITIMMGCVGGMMGFVITLFDETIDLSGIEENYQQRGFDCLVDEIVFPFKRLFNIDARNQYGHTDLHRAVLRSDLEDVTYFLKKGADPLLLSAEDSRNILELSKPAFIEDLKQALIKQFGNNFLSRLERNNIRSGRFEGRFDGLESQRILDYPNRFERRPFAQEGTEERRNTVRRLLTQYRQESRPEGFPEGPSEGPPEGSPERLGGIENARTLHRP